MSIQATNLKSAFGKALGTPATLADIDSAFLAPSLMEQEFNMVPTNKTEVRRVKSSIDQVNQAFQGVLTPAGILSLEPRSIQLQDLKYELELDPDVIEDSYLSFLADPDNNDRKSWGIVKYAVNELMINVGRNNFSMFEIYKGVKAAIVPGTASALGASYNGLGKTIADLITATTLTPVAGPASWSTTPATFVTEVEAWVEACKATSEVNRSIIDTIVDRIHMSTTLAARFRQGMKDKYNANYARVTDPAVLENTPNIRIVGLTEMSGRNRIMMSFKANRAGFIKRPKGEMEVGVNEANPYKPVAFAKYWKGFGFWHPEYLFVNQLV